MSATDAEPGAVVRRAPFSDNPQVGARGQRTQQRILDAALQMFGDVGYHQCSIDSITNVAGCSRISFYQYFSSKEDVFRHLGAQVARQLDASTDRLDPLTPDAGGWKALRGWVGRYAEIYERYEPVFLAFPAAAESDSMLERDSVRRARHHLVGIRTRITTTSLPARDLDPVILLLRLCLTRTLLVVSMLRAAASDAYPQPRVLDAFTDVAHRTIFGLLPGVNVHTHRRARPPKVPFGPVMRNALAEEARQADGSRGGPARAALLAAGRDVFVVRGFHGTRVDDIAAAAGVSHGAFYRYFKNKDELAHLLAAQAIRNISTTLVEIPEFADRDASSRTAFRRWLRAYNQAQVAETAMIRVWVDAARRDESLMSESASVLDWGRRRMARFLGGRAFGDADMDAVVLLALIDAFGVRERQPRMVDAAVIIVERGLMGW